MQTKYNMQKSTVILKKCVPSKSHLSLKIVHCFFKNMYYTFALILQSNVLFLTRKQFISTTSSLRNKHTQIINNRIPFDTY